AERAEYLDRACGPDAALRGRVEALLRAHAGAGEFLEPRLADAPATRPGPGPDVIGAYKLLEQIGEGGFGIVYMAEQTRPVRRMVALKVLKPGMDTQEVGGRFAAERE